MKSFIPFLIMTLLVVGCSSPTSSTSTASTAKALTTFSFAGLTPAVTGTVTESTHTVALAVPYGTVVTALVATFTTTGASVKVGTTSQVSATTANNFTSPVTYTVTAADGSSQVYVVTVTVVVSAVSLSGIVTTLAGSGAAGAINATGTSASFSGPLGVATDGTNVYVADVTNNLIRKIVISTGAVTTLAGSVAGGSLNATGTAASFNSPTGVATDGTNVYVADSGNNMIRQIVISTGVVTTLAGSVAGGSFNATGTAASFSMPYGVATDGTNVYVADSNNNLIRKIVISTGVVTTLAGSLNYGSTNATGTAARFDFPVGLATDGTKLFVADAANNLIRQIVIGTGAVTTLAGSGTAGSLNATGTAASFNCPTGVATDGANLYVADQSNKLLREIVISTGVVTTLAGSGTAGSLNATGTAASFSRPYGVAMNANVPSQLFVADETNNLIREIQ
jgi:DNA-binding beta-propeller fold protein YncE